MDEESQRRFPPTAYTNSKDRGDFGSKFTFNTDSGGERYIVIEIDFLSQVSRFFNSMPKEQLSNVVCDSQQEFCLIFTKEKLKMCIRHLSASHSIRVTLPHTLKDTKNVSKTEIGELNFSSFFQVESIQRLFQVAAGLADHEDRQAGGHDCQLGIRRPHHRLQVAPDDETRTEGRKERSVHHAGRRHHAEAVSGQRAQLCRELRADDEPGRRPRRAVPDDPLR